MSFKSSCYNEFAVLHVLSVLGVLTVLDVLPGNGVGKGECRAGLAGWIGARESRYAPSVLRSQSSLTSV